MSKKGYLDGTEMATTFNMLRANDLIWSFVVNNYLMGKDPFPFDLLFWNADATRMPAAMHMYYLRNMYQKNLLVKPGGLVLDNVPIDLRKITIPVYIQSGKEDHIAPAKSVYKATQIFSGPVRFMLAGSGHIAGVVNPPSAKKYQHWLNEVAKNPPTLAEWQAGAVEHPGSWWNDWDKWLSEKSGPMVPARVPGAGGLPAIEDAPGSYVKVRLIDEDEILMRRILAGVVAFMTATTASAADLQVIAGGGIAGPLTILSHQFEAASGNKLAIRFAATPELIKMATSDVPFDLAVVPREVFKDAGALARFDAAPPTPIARVGFGVAVRAGAPRPDIGTPDAMKQALLKAKSIAFVPQSAAGAQVLRAFEKLGIADAMRAKTRVQPTPADITLAVARGDAELGVFLLNVLIAPGVDLVGPFPPPLQQEFVFAAALSAGPKNAAAAHAFVEFLKSPHAAETLKAKGVIPG